MKKLLIVDDQVMLLDVMSRQFAKDADLKLVCVAKDGNEAISMVARYSPDVVMLDVDLGGGMSGFDVLREIRDKIPRIVIVSMFENPMYRNRAFSLGADAYATKGIRFQTLRALLLDDASIVIPSEELGRFWRNTSLKTGDLSSVSLPSLSERERAVVVEIANGALEKEVADHLGISVSATSTYLRRAMEKLGVKTRAELLHRRIVFRD